MKRFTIAVSGLSGTDASQLEDELHRINADQWKLVDGASAYLLIVDIDTAGGHMDWLRATTKGQHVAAFTVNEHIRGANLVLHKPLRTGELADILQQLEGFAEHRTSVPTEIARPPGVNVAHQDMSAKPEPLAEAKTSADMSSPLPIADIAKTPATITTDTRPPREARQSPAAAADAQAPEPEGLTPQATTPLKPEPEPMTLGESLLSDQIKQPVYIKGEDGTKLCLDPERGNYTGSSKLKPLQPLPDQLMDKARPLDDTDIQHMRDAPAMPLTRLLWFAALSATPGQLAVSLDPVATYRLARWPQIEREFPRHFRIATTMMKQAGTLGDIATNANASITDVTDFINAYSATGYVVCDDTQARSEQATAASGKGMFSRLRRPFSRTTDGQNR